MSHTLSIFPILYPDDIFIGNGAFAVQQGSIAFLTGKGIISGNDFAAQHDQIDSAVCCHAVIGGISTGRMQIIVAEGALLRRVDEDDVGIAARQKGSFFRIESKNFRRIGTGSLYELFQ